MATYCPYFLILISKADSAVVQYLTKSIWQDVTQVTLSKHEKTLDFQSILLDNAASNGAASHHGDRTTLKTYFENKKNRENYKEINLGYRSRFLLLTG